MQVKLTKEIGRELIENIFVTALEGGSNYWYFLSQETTKKIRNAVPKSLDPYLSTAIVKAIFDFGIDVDINDAENEDEILGTINAKNFQERLQLLADSPNSHVLDSELNENGDAETSDVIFQYITMGEVVFS